MAVLEKPVNELKNFIIGREYQYKLKNMFQVVLFVKKIKSSNKILRPPMQTSFITDRPFQKIFVYLLCPYQRSS